MNRIIIISLLTLFIHSCNGYNEKFMIENVQEKTKPYFSFDLIYEIKENEVIEVNLINDLNQNILKKRVLLSNSHDSKKILLLPNLSNGCDSCSLIIHKLENNIKKRVIGKINQIKISNISQLPQNKIFKDTVYLKFKKLPESVAINQNYELDISYSINQNGRLLIYILSDEISKDFLYFRKKIPKGVGEQKINFSLPKSFFHLDNFTMIIEIKPLKAKWSDIIVKDQINRKIVKHISR